MLDRNGEPMVIAGVPWGEEDTDGVSRMVELAVPAAVEALATLTTDCPVDVLLALPEPRPGLPESFAIEVANRLAVALSKQAPLGKVKVKSRGHAGGLALLGAATATLAREAHGLVLVGGIDSWLVPETLEWVDSIEALHSTAMPWGFCPGEAAAFCLLASVAQDVGRLAIAGFGESMEANRIRTETVCTGEGLSAAWRRALARLQGTDHRVDRIWCDLNSEPYRGDEIAFSVTRVREYLSEDVDLVTPADAWGDVGAATGPLLLIAAEAAALKSYAPGPWSLVSASSNGGSRAALLAYDRAVAGDGSAR